MRDETVIIRKSPASFAYLFWLTGVRRGEHAVVKPAGTTVGRDAACEIVLDDETVSLEQARIRREEDGWVLYDLASANRTEAAGAPVYVKVLADGDHITFGTTEMVFRDLA